MLMPNGAPFSIYRCFGKFAESQKTNQMKPFKRFNTKQQNQCGEARLYYIASSEYYYLSLMAMNALEMADFLLVYSHAYIKHHRWQRLDFDYY